MVAFEGEENPKEFETEGMVLEAAPGITPLAVEKRVSGTIGGVKVRGIIDLLDTNGCIARVDTLVRTKTPQLVRQSIEITDADRKYAETAYPVVQEQMRSGIYMPNRGSMFCSRSSCAFCQACEAEFGGRVKE